MENRHGNRSTLVTSQLPVEKWHEYLGDPTLADAIMDRLVHNAYKLPLRGESMSEDERAARVDQDARGAGSRSKPRRVKCSSALTRTDEEEQKEARQRRPRGEAAVFNGIRS